MHNLINNHMKQQVEIEHNRNAKQFNRIVKNDMDMHRNKYIKRQILKKIDVIITNKMYSMIKNQGA